MRQGCPRPFPGSLLDSGPLSPPGFPAAAYGPVAAAAVAAARGSGRKVYGTGGSQACPSVRGKVKALLDLCGCVCPLLSPQPGGWGQGGSGQALPPRVPPSQGQSRDCKPKVDYYSVIAKKKNDLLFDFGWPLHLTAGFRAPVVISLSFCWFRRLLSSGL